MKSPEQRFADAEAALRSRVHFSPGRLGEAAEVARAVLEAADHEPPKWPTNASVNTYHADYLTAFGKPPCGIFEDERAVLRDAFLADPIIKAAIDVRVAWINSGDLGRTGRGYITALIALCEAVKEAGL